LSSYLFHICVPRGVCSVGAFAFMRVPLVLSLSQVSRFFDLELPSAFPHVRFATIDVDASPGLSDAAGARQLPLFVLYAADLTGSNGRGSSGKSGKSSSNKKGSGNCGYRVVAELIGGKKTALRQLVARQYEKTQS